MIIDEKELINEKFIPISDEDEQTKETYLNW